MKYFAFYIAGHLTEADRKKYISNMQKSAAAGFKYFEFDGSEHEILLELRDKGKVEVLLDLLDGGCVVTAEGKLDFARFEIK